MEPGRDLSMKTAIRTMRIIHFDLSIVNATSWSWWLAVSNGNYKDGLLYTNWKHNGDAEDILPSKLFWCLGNFSPIRKARRHSGADRKRAKPDVSRSDHGNRVPQSAVEFIDGCLHQPPPTKA